MGTGIDIIRVIEPVVGRVIQAAPIDASTQGEVWRLLTAQGARLIYKQHHSAAAFGRERRAYEQWAPQLFPFVPQLLHVVEEPRPALIIAAAEGHKPRRAGLSREQLRQAYRLAGGFRRALDRVAVVPDLLPIHEALTLRFAAWCGRAGRFLAPGRLGEIRRRFDPSIFADVPRVASHRDFGAHNWLVRFDGEPALTVIDFGQSRPDVELTDLVKLREGPFRRSPELAEAFYEGWGRTPDPVDQYRLQHLTLLHGLATEVWGHEHRDRNFSAAGRDIVDRTLNA